MSEKNQVFLVMCQRESGVEIVGVYDDQQLAEEVCITDKYWIGPLYLNETTPFETTQWPGQYVPAWKYESGTVEQ